VVRCAQHETQLDLAGPWPEIDAGEYRMAEGTYIGIDIGTGGVRALAAGPDGLVIAQSRQPLPQNQMASDGLHEQMPEAWWQAVRTACGELISALGGVRIAGLAVDGTSGTLVVVDEMGRSLRPALMYNDGRAQSEAEALTEAAGPAFCRRLGYRFGASYALAKIAWLRNHEAGVFSAARWFIHQADFIVGRLAGEFGITDYSNALKTGYDVIDGRWPDWMDRALGVTDRLPRVVAPGTRIGEVSAIAARQTGLPAGTPVVAGVTDGVAACIASGARRVGDHNTTLGTTLVFKAVSGRIGIHPHGLVYSHKLPEGRWVPGAASNTGAEWIHAYFPTQAPSALDAAAADYLPSPCLAYPLARRGERFPFLDPDARGFSVPGAGNAAERYAACLQGTAFIERMGYETLDAITGARNGEVFSTGGGSASDVWMQCRADATGRPIHRPACPESALGCAILAAAGCGQGSLWEVASTMVRIERSFWPDSASSERYEETYGRFLAEMEARGYR